MDVHAPLSVLAARYSSREAAVRDVDTVWSTRQDGAFHHTALALLGRDACGRLRVERSKSTAKHLVWGGALLGGPLYAVAPESGLELLAVVGLSGAGAIIEHLHGHADPEQRAQVADVLSDAAWGVLVVAVNRRREELAPLLARAEGRAAVQLPWGDLEEELCHDVPRPVAELVVLGS